MGTFERKSPKTESGENVEKESTTTFYYSPLFWGLLIFFSWSLSSLYFIFLADIPIEVSIIVGLGVACFLIVVVLSAISFVLTVLSIRKQERGW